MAKANETVAELLKSLTQQDAVTTTSSSAAVATAATAATATATTTAMAHTATTGAPLKQGKNIDEISKEFKEVIKKDNLISFSTYFQLECRSELQALQILFFAAEQGSPFILSQLLFDYPDFTFAKYQGKTLFDIAHPKVYTELMINLEKTLGSEINVQSKEELTLLKEFSEILKRNYEKSAVKARNAQAFKGKSDSEILCNLAEHGKIVSFLAILKTAPSLELINRPIANGYRPIHFAAINNQLAILDCIVDIWEQTPKDTVWRDEILLIKSDNGKTAMDLAHDEAKCHSKFKEAYEEALARKKAVSQSEPNIKTNQDKVQGTAVSPNGTGTTCVHNHNHSHCSHAKTASTVTTETNAKAADTMMQQPIQSPAVQKPVSNETGGTVASDDNIYYSTISMELKNIIEKDQLENFNLFITSTKLSQPGMLSALYYAAKCGAENILFGHFKKQPNAILVKSFNKKTFFDIAAPRLLERLLGVLKEVLAEPEPRPEIVNRLTEFKELYKEYSEKLEFSKFEQKKKMENIVAEQRKRYKGKDDVNIIYTLAGKDDPEAFEAMVYCYPELLAKPIAGGYCAIHAAACYDRLRNVDIIIKAWHKTQNHQFLLAESEKHNTAMKIAGEAAKKYKPFIEACGEAKRKREAAQPKVNQEEAEYRKQIEQRILADEKLFQEKRQQAKLNKIVPTLQTVETDNHYQKKCRALLFDIKREMLRARNLEFMEEYYNDDMFHTDLVSKGYLEALQALMALGVKPGTTWMHEAAKKDQIAVLDFLMKQGEATDKLQDYLSAEDEKGRTPFECAGDKAKQFPAFVNATKALQQARKAKIEAELDAINKERDEKELYEHSQQAEMKRIVDALKKQENEEFSAHEIAVKKEISTMPVEILEAIRLDNPLLLKPKLDQISYKFLLLRHAISEGALNVLKTILPLLSPEIIFSNDKYGQNILAFSSAKNQEAINALLEKRVWQNENFQEISNQKGDVKRVMELKKKLILKIIDSQYKKGHAAAITTSAAQSTTTASKAGTAKEKLIGKAIFLGDLVNEEKMQPIIQAVVKDDLAQFALLMQPIIHRLKEYDYPENEKVVCELRQSLLQLAEMQKAHNILFCYLVQDDIFVPKTVEKEDKEHEDGTMDPVWRMPKTEDPIEKAAEARYEAEVLETRNKNSLSLD